MMLIREAAAAVGDGQSEHGLDRDPFDLQKDRRSDRSAINRPIQWRSRNACR